MSKQLFEVTVVQETKNEYGTVTDETVVAETKVLAGSLAEAVLLTGIDFSESLLSEITEAKSKRSLCTFRVIVKQES